VYVAKDPQRPRNWPADKDRAWQRRLAQSRIELWTEQLERGQRPATPQLEAALAVERALVARITRELDAEGPGPEKAPGAVVGV
jgi:hypothetical protein